MQLNEQVVQRFRIAKVFRDNASHVTSLDIDDSGQLAVSSAIEETALHVYDCFEGEHRSVIMLSAREVSRFRFLPKSRTTALFACRGEADGFDVCQMDLGQNTFARALKGHTGLVRSIEVADSTVMTSSADDGGLIWDLRQGGKARGHLPAAGPIAIDPQGLVFAACLPASKHLLMYDCRKWDKMQDTGSQWCDLRFSPDGKDLLLNTLEDSDIYVIDSFEGNIRHKLTGRAQNTSSRSLEASWSPDSQWVVASGMDGALYAWSRATGQLVARLEGHPRQSLVCRFNPRSAMLVSACTNLQEMSHMQWLESVSAMYKEAAVVTKDVDQALRQFGALNPRTDYCRHVVPQQLLIALSGTIHVDCKDGGRYNVPVELWLPIDYPLSQPITFVTPTAGLSIKPSKRVNAAGLVLTGKSRNVFKVLFTSKTYLVDYLEDLQEQFAEDMPVYMPAAGMGGFNQAPMGASPSAFGSPTTFGGFTQQQPQAYGQQLPPQQPASFGVNQQQSFGGAFPGQMPASQQLPAPQAFNPPPQQSFGQQPQAFPPQQPTAYQQPPAQPQSFSQQASFQQQPQAFQPPPAQSYQQPPAQSFQQLPQQPQSFASQQQPSAASQSFATQQQPQSFAPQQQPQSFAPQQQPQSFAPQAAPPQSFASQQQQPQAFAPQQQQPQSFNSFQQPQQPQTFSGGYSGPQSFTGSY